MGSDPPTPITQTFVDNTIYAMGSDPPAPITQTLINNTVDNAILCLLITLYMLWAAIRLHPLHKHLLITLLQHLLNTC